MPNSIVELFNRCHQLDSVEQQKIIDKLRQDDPEMADELDALLKAEPTKFGIPANSHDHQGSFFQIPQIIDEYRVEGILGVGGMGMVLQGHRADIDLSVAIKLAHQSSTDTTTKIALEQEAKILASLEHPNIASIKDWGTIDNFGHFIATEFIRGKTIRQYCEDENLSIKVIIQLFLKVISAVSHAHSRLVLHRDIKPSNIMVTDQGEPKLIDFGVAKILSSIHASEEQTLSAGMTPTYASPEQLAGKPLSIRSDVYSLGLVLLTLLCDEEIPQHNAHQIKEILLKQKKEKPQSFRTISKQNCQELALVLAKACHEDADQRYENSQGLSRDLTAILNQKPIEARTPGFTYRLKKFVTRNKWATAISGAALALAFMGFTIGVGYWKKEQQTFQDLKKSQEELLTYTDFLEEILKGMDVAAGGSASVTMGDFLERTTERPK
jgi:serine/threonine-protein kinase